MINKKLLTLLVLPFMIVGCTKGGGNKPDPIDPTKPFELIPQVGEVRLLFSVGEAGETRIYNYCPSVFNENNVQHVYYCTNEIEGNVTDFVGYRKGVVANNKMSFTENDLVVSHGAAGSWDYRHACDPSVIKGEFKFHNETYNYLMAYLGCVPSDCTLNETGIAVSKTPEGPWVKCDYKLDGEIKINPIVPYADFSMNDNSWGTGQPSLVSVDGKGRVLLFTTVGASNGTFTNVREYDFSDIDNYQKIRERTKILETGIRYNGQGGGFINNADFAYDETTRRFLMVKGRQFFGKDNISPNFIADTLDVYYIDDTEGTNIGDIFFAGNNTNKQWKLIDSIDESKTGFLRNHNSGLITDPYGHYKGEDRIGVAFTRSDKGESTNWSYLSTYRIYATSVAFPENYYN